MTTPDSEKAPNSPERIVGHSLPELEPEKGPIVHPTLGSVSVCPETGSDNTSIEHDAESRHDVDLETTISTPKTLVKVPVAERRGLFARFAIVAEVTEPVNYSPRLKWFLTAIVAIAGAAAPVGSATILREHDAALDQVAKGLHSTPTVTNLSVALYLLSMAIFPLWWSNFSETLGRRTIYLVSFAMFVLFSVLSAISTSIGMLIAMRLLAGGASASVQAVGAGTVADLWEVHERGRAMSMFYLGPLCGPLLAPIIGGVLAEELGWRSTQWAQVVFGTIIWICIFFILPETLRSTKHPVQKAEVQAINQRPPLTRTSTRQSVQQKSLKWIKVLKIMFVDPLRVIYYLRFPPVLLTVYYASVTFGALYVLNISIQYTFARPPYEFPTIILGLLYIPNSIGYMLTSLFGGKWIDSIMKREAVKANRVTEDGKLIYQPEDRMKENAWIAAFMYPCALIWYGWTAQHGVFWLAPMIANFFYGIGSMLIFAMATTMLTEFMPKRSSSGVALNNLMRNTFSCAGAIVGAPVISAIGDGWLFTIIGLWALTSGIAVIWLMKRFGPRWRLQMNAHFD